jgi:pSer/pThr/pTyr-binding forkhead associated (FHA) protein
MVVLEVVAGRQAGRKQAAGRLPWVVGRSAAADLQLEEPGVFDRHLELRLNDAEAFEVSVEPGAVARVNGQPVQQALLHNGDLIELGAAKLRFWLAETRQRSQRWREILTWASLIALSLAQIVLIYWLSP